MWDILCFPKPLQECDRKEPPRRPIRGHNGIIVVVKETPNILVIDPRITAIQLTVSMTWPGWATTGLAR